MTNDDKQFIENYRRDTEQAKKLSEMDAPSVKESAPDMSDLVARIAELEAQLAATQPAVEAMLRYVVTARGKEQDFGTKSAIVASFTSESDATEYALVRGARTDGRVFVEERADGVVATLCECTGGEWFAG